ncbi:hypothetical protein SARC_04838 [Sphaeroforma arctica JP610]|uniref:Uncharacterized protein n=1 Tax=Sphaeroforma arctica JP610 TaxID=667725 RepID=A0A0L0G1B8_9EUKA|nr:hypothetical protein SARC_04838 [Sphaeroforma arctica JP610]KNC82895.1 hypothetical protein SARC_04838 [Sphaeroforma arctica JP610]|eukprot:XP_014156797.1 hypothetical protein SARC_04838 [Sphaeroforma arctica JP610]
MGGAVLSATESNLHASDIRTLDTESFSKRIISGGFDGQLYITALERSGQSSGHVLSKYNSSAMDSANISTGTILRQRRFPSVISSVSLFSGGQTGAVTTDNGSVMLIDTRSPRLIAFQYDEKVTTFGERKAPLYTHVFSSDAQAYLGYDGGEIRILDTRVGDIVGRRKDSVLKAIGDLSLSANGSLCATGYGGVSFSNASASNLDWERQSSHCHVSTDAMGGLETTSGAWLELENGKSQFFVADDCGHLSVFNDPYEQIVSPDRHY